MSSHRHTGTTPRHSRENTATDLSDAVITGDAPSFDPFTGVDVQGGEVPQYSPSMKVGLEAPRFCQLCGRRMVVQVRPDGWNALCSRHGELDSAILEPQR
ncbi:hypothetical protein ACGE24_03165 [Corynebacterium kroppenstedtii]|uniref:biotin synthase auxiliary protein BsaP n=1 Tax=Corynebacterium sp. PCR 32 TaxID=3351342 RepID=UPI0030A8B39D